MWYIRVHGIYKSMVFRSKKVLLLPSVPPGTEYTWALIWKKSLIICFESYQGIPYLFWYIQSRQEFGHFANDYITRILYEILKRINNQRYLLIIILCKETKYKLACISSIENILLHSTTHKTFLSTDKKHPLVKWTAKYVFSIGAAIKIAVLVLL